MFRIATNFNQPIGNWNVGNVLDMYEMFFDAESSFYQDISNWDVSNVEDCSRIFFRLSTKAGSKFRRSFKPNFRYCRP
jgi:hypothetical protein